ncbi:hypothetical protein PG987_014037 [Apiospora arundinis]
MACDKTSQQTSIEELEHRFAKLTTKVNKASSQASKDSSQKVPRGTGIFRKPAREITEANFLDELDRVEQQLKANQAKKPAREITEANFLEELDRVERQLMANKAKKAAETSVETEMMLSELEKMMNSITTTMDRK